MSTAGASPPPVDRPVAVMPWLHLDAPMTVGGVTFASRDDLPALLAGTELDQALALLDCFSATRGDRTHSAGQTMGVVTAGPPTTPAERDEQRTRLSYAADALAALVLATDSETSATAETVRTYIFPRLPAGLMTVPLPNGGLDMTSTAVFRIARDPWIRNHAVRIPSEEGPTVAALTHLIDRAVGGDQDAERLLVALTCFVKAHGYGIDTRASSNLGDLATAFEVLTAVSGRRDKTEGLKNAVKVLTGSDALADRMRELYRVRSGETHAGRILDPALPDRHMHHYQYGWLLFWTCLRAKLDADGVLPYPTKDTDVARLEASVTANARRLQQLVAGSATAIATRRSRQEEFLSLLRALHANPFDGTGSPDQCRRALQRVLVVIQTALEGAALARAAEDPAMDEALRALAGQTAATATAIPTVPAGSLDSHWLISTLLPLHITDAAGATLIRGYHPAMDIPIIADHGLRLLLLDRELVGGLADMVGERDIWG